MKLSSYTKLPGRGWAWTGPSRVWLGEDHVLLVLGQVFFESYRRFFLKDIQAVIVRRTHTGKTWSGIWAAGLLFFAGIAALVGDRTAALILLGIATPFGIALLINVLLGPTCACYVRTAVQTERLHAVSRLRTTRKFMARVEPLVIAAQGELPAEQFAADLASLQFQAGAPLSYAPPVLGS